jgi:CheY-like chemotaxis protein
LNAICKRATFEFALSIGKVVIDNVYAGDLRAWRDRGPKDASFRKLAKHPDLPMSPSALYRSVAIYELSARLGISPRGQLSSSHLRVVLPFSHAEQERLVRRAEVERWSVARLSEETALLAQGRGRGGRGKKPPLLTTLRTLGKCLDGTRGSLLRANASAVELSPEQAREAAALVDRVRCACGTLEAKLLAEVSNNDVQSQSTAGGPDFLEQESDGDADQPAGLASVSIARRNGGTAASRILIVDDNPTFGRILGRIAQAYGEVVLAETARQAEAAIAGSGKSWKAFILDVALADGSGLDVLARARERFPSTRALLITGYLDPRKTNAAFRLQADFLAKPFRRADLQRFLQSAG